MVAGRVLKIAGKMMDKAKRGEIYVIGMHTPITATTILPEIKTGGLRVRGRERERERGREEKTSERLCRLLYNPSTFFNHSLSLCVSLSPLSLSPLSLSLSLFLLSLSLLSLSLSLSSPHLTLRPNAIVATINTNPPTSALATAYVSQLATRRIDYTKSSGATEMLLNETRKVAIIFINLKGLRDIDEISTDLDLINRVFVCKCGARARVSCSCAYLCCHDRAPAHSGLAPVTQQSSLMLPRFRAQVSQPSHIERTGRSETCSSRTRVARSSQSLAR